MIAHAPDSPSIATHRFRSGTAARLAGLPVTTLRVWERRYGVAAAGKTASGQRVYSSHDVSRLRLLRELTVAGGHAIGTIATLDLAALQALVDHQPELPLRWQGAPLEVIVVGRGVAPALEALPGFVLRAVHHDLARAEAAPSSPGRIGLLLVRVASLQPGVVERVLRLAGALGAKALFVLYAFGTEASARSLRESGASVRREPLSDVDLAQWVRGLREAAAAPPVDAAWQIAPRRFSDEALTRLARLPSPVACECLRHMAELVAQLASFERYSEECVSTGPADAALHRHLTRTAAASRTLFETALQRIVDEERLEPADEQP